MKTEIDSSNYPQWLATATECRNLIFQSLDLTIDDDTLASLPQAASEPENCIFLGCTLGPKLAARAACHHALVFPDLPGRTYRPFRHELYTVEELFGPCPDCTQGYDPNVPDSYLHTVDWKTFTSYIKVGPDNKSLKPMQFVDAGLDEILARRLHDNFIDDELDEFLDGFRGDGTKGIVAIMGGHDKTRSDPDFKKVAALSRNLTLHGYLIASGGGPGLMEAANMGAFFASRTEPELFKAIDRMAKPNASDSYADPEWLKAAWQVRQEFLPADWNVCRSLGIPTWFYGHEPPNIFASHIAKYFENSLREEGLLAIATHGVIFAEGNGGTIQEIFQDACQNYYDNYGFKSPMILFGKDYWQPKPQSLDSAGYPVYADKVYPAWPLLQGLAQKKNFTNLTSLTSDTDEILAIIRAFKAPWEVNA
jgi:predicted Rossmann-fold nucleotide-binding protein